MSHAKNIGIVTWTESANYGTELQAFALSYVIKSMGDNPYIIRWFSPSDFNLKRRLQLLLIRYNNRKRLIKEFGNIQKYKKIKLFEKRHLTYYPRIKTNFQYRRMLSLFNCFISGSDQILNPLFVCPFYLLTFAKDIRKITYASSIGVRTIPLEKEDLYKKSLCTFNAISAREENGREELARVSNTKVTTVLDPTLLINREQWIDICKNISLKKCLDSNEKYILCYFIGENEWYWTELENIRKKTGIDRVIVIPLCANHYKSHFEVIDDASPLEFVQLINYSYLICTDSFHASSFCINLQKNFVVFLRFSENDKGSQNSRIHYLLEHFHLQEQLYSTNFYHFQCDFSYSANMLKDDRLKSLDFLKNATSEN